MGNSQYAITIFDYCVHRETKKCSSSFMDLGKERSIQLDASTEVWMLHQEYGYFTSSLDYLESGRFD